MYLDAGVDDIAAKLKDKHFDVCIAGAGAVGISMANRIVEQTEGKKTVLLLESSKDNLRVGWNYQYDSTPRFQDNYQQIRDLDLGTMNPFLQKLRDGKFMTLSRSRCLGGSTNCWGGFIRPMDRYDFLIGDVSKWPFDRKELDDYYFQALSLVRLDPIQFGQFDHPDYWCRRSSEQQTLVELEPALLKEYGLKTVVIQRQHYQKSYPDGSLNFQETFSELLAGPSVCVIKNCTVIEPAVRGGTPNRVIGFKYGAFTDLTKDDGAPRTFNLPICIADYFVLALGGLEVTRFLLNLRENNNQVKLGADLGKYYMNHPKYISCAKALLPDSHWWDKHYDQANRCEPVLNFYASETFTLFDKNELPKFSYPYIQAYLVPTEDRIASFTQPPVSNFRVVLNWHNSDTGIPGTHAVIAELNFEQVPNTNSIIKLDPDPDKKDKFSQRLLSLDWQFSKQDADTVNNSMLIVKDYLKAYIKGSNWDFDKYWTRIHWAWDDKDPETQLPPLYDCGDSNGVRTEIYTGDHHMGTCRMGTDASAVVDPQCLVKDFDNFYLCSTAVFPTGGWANATHTLLALSLRLAEHLALQKPAVTVLYDRKAGQADVVGFDATGKENLRTTNSGWRTTWDLIVAGDFLGNGRKQILLYDRNAGQAAVVGFDAQGKVNLETLNSGWSRSGDLIVAGDFLGNGRKQILLYSREESSGYKTWVPAGQAHLVGFDGIGKANLHTHSVWRTTWDDLAVL
jgi:hypothetical protein